MTEMPRNPAVSLPAPRPRAIGAVNWVGLWTLYLKEVKRFVNVLTQTVLAPIITMLLFLAVFTLALGRGNLKFGDIPYAEFLAPGLIMMAMIQNAFANTSSSILMSKIQGNIVDVLMPPLSTVELALGFALGGLTRGLLVGVTTALAMWVFIPLQLHNLGFVLYYGVAAALMLSLLGMVGGIWAEKFDHVAALTNFVIVPLSFLSGTFYSVARLPENWQFVAHLNPFFYLIDGFRFGFLGRNDGDILTGMAVVAGANALLVGLVWLMLSRGYKLKP
ncbi:ABC transporter permease [Algihabitans albus]|uniref:ABC transporter permease n=1 Tax=Algihabitans albus TaxID=2164067 RepID=UPI001F27021F|nr:ABC transporter permease [Algihabitans albus]